MEVIVAYLDQKHIDLTKQLLRRRTTPEERMDMTQHAVTTSIPQAERLVEHFHSTGHIAYIFEVKE